MNHKRASIAIFLFILSLTVIITLLTELDSKKVRVVQANQINNGILDLQSNTLPTKKIIGLTGNVEFYWEKLLSPQDFASDSTLKPDGYVKIPGVWNDFQVDGKPVGSKGYATYRFKIKVPDNAFYGLKIKEFDCAYTIWVNGDQKVSAGIVGTSKKDYKPSWKRNELYFHAHNNEIEIVMQIANFDHRKGGAEDRLLFGRANDIRKFKYLQLGISFFLLGALFILTVYHLILYIFRPKEIAYLGFSVICFLMIIRLITVDEKLLIDFFPNISWYYAIRLEYLSYKLFVPFLMGFMYLFFPKYISRTILKATVYITVLFCLVVIFTPVSVFSYTPVYFQALIFISSVYMIVVLTKATIKKEENSTIFLLSFVFFFLVTINDILMYNNSINTSYIMPLGTSILAFSYAIVLSKNFSSAFIKVEELSVDLENYNRELEHKVELRTQEIAEQRDEIEAQAENLMRTNQQLLELSEFKESLSEMIVHDLKNPINIILNFSKDERVVFAGTQMLNLVQNLLDVQRYENSEMKLVCEPISVLSLIDETMYQLNFLVKEKNIEVIVQSSGQYYINADHEIMNRVFVNLMSNALKFTPSGGKVTITVKLRSSFIVVCFSDTGPGIPKDKKDVVFEKFGQIIRNPNGKLGSSGLGLTFCKMAVEAHGGKIDFTSVLGKGTSFCIKIPATYEQQNMPSKEISTNYKPLENTIELSADEIKLLVEIVDQLANTEIYEIGKIKKLLSGLDEQKSENIEKWAAALQKSIFNDNVELYNSLIKQARGE